MKKVLIAIFLFALNLIMLSPLYGRYQKLSNTYEYSAENHSISIEVLKDKNVNSYANQVRIVSITLNGEKLDLSAYETDNWVWHEEWGYIFYEDGEPEITFDFDEPIESLSLEYVKEAESGKIAVYLDDTKVKNIDLYSARWTNKTLTINCVNENAQIALKVQIFLILCIFELILFWIIKLLKHKDEPIESSKKTIGMFDFAKGCAMIFVIGYHSVNCIVNSGDSFGSAYNLITALVFLPLLYGVVAMFFIASGYGFRVGKIEKISKQQLKFWAKPYLIVAVGVVVVCILKLLFAANFGLADLKYYCLPFVLGTAHEGSLFGIEIFSVGPLWFGIALCFGWIILNCILNIKSRKMQLVAWAALLILGFVFSINDLNFWCIPQIIFTAILLYVGYLIRKKNIFSNETKKNLVFYLLGFVVFIVLANINGSLYSPANAHWGNNYFLSIIGSIYCGVALLWLMLRLNKPLKGKANHIKAIGRNSYYIFYIHSFEYLVIPWGEIYSNLQLNKWLGLVMIFVSRSIVIYVIYKMLGLGRGKKG